MASTVVSLAFVCQLVFALATPGFAAIVPLSFAAQLQEYALKARKIEEGKRRRSKHNPEPTPWTHDFLLLSLTEPWFDGRDFDAYHLVLIGDYCIFVEQLIRVVQRVGVEPQTIDDFDTHLPMLRQVRLHGSIHSSIPASGPSTTSSR